MKKLWQGRLDGQSSTIADMFNKSIDIDCRMYKQDIDASIAHAKMLGKQEIISHENSDEIVATLYDIKKEIETGVLDIDMSFEDIHTFIEHELTKRISDSGKMLHTARSRNDQVATDFRMYVKDEIKTIIGLLKKLVYAITEIADSHINTVMPGYTHLQRAQPVMLGHHLMAYAMMFLRDIKKYSMVLEITDECPLGSGALAGVAYPIDRFMTAYDLGFSSPCKNSIDAVSDRDFATDVCYANSLVMMHLSRFCEELIIWSSWEFKFCEISDAFSTGSSIMPQKKNPDITELIRGKSANVFSHVQSLLTMQKSLVLAYNKDMQQDKQTTFMSIDTVKACVTVFTDMLKQIEFFTENMKNAALNGYINATDCADYLTNKSVPFRDAYKITGNIVNYCIKNKKTLETLILNEYLNFSDLFESDIFEYIKIDNCVKRRKSYGGTSPESINAQIDYVRSALDD